MSYSTFGTAQCFGQREMLAKSVRHFNLTHKSGAVVAVAPATKLTKPTTGSIAMKMETDSGADSKARSKFVHMWQHLISQANAPMARRPGSLFR
jgi:hypothetical protein